MIGRLRFDHYEATLDDEETWSVPANRNLELMLNVAFGPPLDYSPAHGFPGINQVIAAAKHFGVPYELAEPPFDPDELY